MDLPSMFCYQVDWVTMNFVPFAERCVELVTEMYTATASHSTVIQAQVLQNIIKVSHMISLAQ